MTTDGLMLDIIKFFKTARHLWGRCPSCGEPFRLSDAGISSSPEPPRDWLRRLDRQQASLDDKDRRLVDVAEELRSREEELNERERDMQRREKNLERDARNRAMQMVKSDVAVKAVIRDSTQAAVMRSRSVLLGSMLERIAPCFARFAHDPRDMRAICNPVDYVVFDGLTAGRTVQQVTFVEVKCGTSRTSPVQRSIREAVKRHRVEWEQWNIGDPRIPITKQLAPARQRGLPSATDD